MRYWLDIPSHVRRQIEDLPSHIRPRVKQTLSSLRDNPRPSGFLALQGELDGYYRIRVNAYRIVYAIHEEVVTVELVRVARRDNQTYKGLR
jgi:mRNA interferase RelE/StbE